MAHPLVELQRLGQSPWHDNIRRDLLTSGALRRMVDDGWITGLTSNPTIFQKAISESDEYDAQLQALARTGRNAEEIFDELAATDIRDAADVFRGVHERTQGADGFVSIEVAPRHAHDTQKTVTEAERLWEMIDRPNLMVKIPATREGIPAIEETIARGINVNVTLIFALERYDEVMEAYLRGLTRRHRAGQPVDHIASVASFFVSRVDSAVDAGLERRMAAVSPEEAARLQRLVGKAAIANARLAYAAFRKKFGTTEAWAALASDGARVQRPLWASTSTKNPAYPDVYYVEALVGPDTVDTLPSATIEAYADHGRPSVRIEEDLDGAREVMEELARAGIDVDAVTRTLEVDGVRAFADSFDALIEVVDERRRAILAASRKPPRRASAKAGRGASASGAGSGKSRSAKHARKTVGRPSATAAKKARKAVSRKRAVGRASKAKRARPAKTASVRRSVAAAKRSGKARKTSPPAAKSRGKTGSGGLRSGVRAARLSPGGRARKGPAQRKTTSTASKRRRPVKGPRRKK